VEACEKFSGLNIAIRDSGYVIIHIGRVASFDPPARDL